MYNSNHLPSQRQFEPAGQSCRATHRTSSYVHCLGPVHSDWETGCSQSPVISLDAIRGPSDRTTWRTSHPGGRLLRPLEAPRFSPSPLPAPDCKPCPRLAGLEDSRPPGPAFSSLRSFWYSNRRIWPTVRIFAPDLVHSLPQPFCVLYQGRCWRGLSFVRLWEPKWWLGKRETHRNVEDWGRCSGE